MQIYFKLIITTLNRLFKNKMQKKKNYTTNENNKIKSDEI